MSKLKDKFKFLGGKDEPKYYTILRDEFNRVYNGDDYVARRDDMDRYLREFTGDWWEKEKLGDNDSEIFANYVFQIVSATAPLLTDNKPIWSVAAREPHMQGIANMYNKAGEYFWDVADMDQRLFLVVQQCLLWPIGLLKVMWDGDDPKVEVDDPRTFAISPGYTDLWEAAWAGVKMRKPMSWVWQMYPDKAPDVKPVENTETWDSIDHGEYSAAMEGVFTDIYEIWVRDPSTMKAIIGKDEEGDDIFEDVPKYPNGRIVTMSDDVILDDRASPYSHGKPPWVAFYDYRVPQSFWGMGEPDQIETLNLEYNFRLQDFAKWAHATGDPNYTIEAGAGLDPEKIKAEMEQGGNLWPVQIGTSDQPIRKVDPGDFGTDQYNMIALLPNIIEEISGVTDITKGQPGKKERQSASEVSILIESAYTRTRQRIRNLEWSLSRAFYLLVELLQQFSTEPRTIQAKDADTGETEFGKVGNSLNMALQASAPNKEPDESDEDYDARVEADPDLNQLLEDFEGVDKVYVPFRVEIQTNSTLPTDRQSHANLMLKLAQTKVSPDSLVDAESIREALNLPNREKIKLRLENLKKQAALEKMKGGQNAPRKPTGLPAGTSGGGKVGRPTLAPEPNRPQ